MSLDLDKSTWKRVSFGDAIESITERVDDPSAAGVDRYVGLEHLDPGVMTVQRWDSPERVSAQKLRFTSGDVIFGRRRAYQKKVAKAEFEGICSAHALVLRARPGMMDSDFLPVFLSSDYFLDRAIGISVGSLSPTINWRDLRGQEFDLPPLDEQKRIADLLWAVERHRAAATASEHGCTRLRSSVVSDALGSTDTHHVPLESLVRDGTSITYGIVQAGPQTSGGVPYIRVSDMTDGVLAIQGMKRTAPEVAAKFARSRVQAGDLVVALRGRTGLTLIVPEELDGANLTQGTARVAVDESKVLPGYVIEVMNSDLMAVEIGRRAKGSTFTELSLAALRALPIPRLGDEEEKRLVRRLADVDGASRAARQEVGTLTTFRSSLLHDVFGGN